MTCHTFYEGSILHQVNWIWILDLGIQLLQLQFWGYLKRQVSSMSLFSTYEKRIGVSKHLLFSSKMVDQEIFPKPFSSCLEDDPFMIRIIITDYSSSFNLVFISGQRNLIWHKKCVELDCPFNQTLSWHWILLPF